MGDAGKVVRPSRGPFRPRRGRLTSPEEQQARGFQCTRTASRRACASMASSTTAQSKAHSETPTAVPAGSLPHLAVSRFRRAIAGYEQAVHARAGQKHSATSDQVAVQPADSGTLSPACAISGCVPRFGALVWKGEIERRMVVHGDHPVVLARVQRGLQMGGKSRACGRRDRQRHHRRHRRRP